MSSKEIFRTGLACLPRAEVTPAGELHLYGGRIIPGIFLSKKKVIMLKSAIDWYLGKESNEA